MASQAIPEVELELYRQHPELIDAIGSRTVIHRVVLATVFVAGLALVVLSKGVKFVLVGSAAPWLMETVVDLLFELGVALWGGVATTVMLNHFMNRQYQIGRSYQQAIRRQLSESSESKGTQ